MSPLRSCLFTVVPPASRLLSESSAARRTAERGGTLAVRAATVPFAAIYSSAAHMSPENHSSAARRMESHGGSPAASAAIVPLAAIRSCAALPYGAYPPPNLRTSPKPKNYAQSSRRLRFSLLVGSCSGRLSPETRFSIGHVGRLARSRRRGRSRRLGRREEGRTEGRPADRQAGK